LSKYLHPRPIRLTCLWALVHKCKKLLTTWVKTNWLRSLAFLNKQSCLLVVLSALKTYQQIKIKNLDGTLS
jgi:hypothetical protein